MLRSTDILESYFPCYIGSLTKPGGEIWQEQHWSCLSQILKKYNSVINVWMPYILMAQPANNIHWNVLTRQQSANPVIDQLSNDLTLLVSVLIHLYVRHISTIPWSSS